MSLLGLRRCPSVKSSPCQSGLLTFDTGQPKDLVQRQESNKKRELLRCVATLCLEMCVCFHHMHFRLVNTKYLTVLCHERKCTKRRAANVIHKQSNKARMNNSAWLLQGLPSFSCGQFFIVLLESFRESNTGTSRLIRIRIMVIPRPIRVLRKLHLNLHNAILHA